MADQILCKQMVINKARKPCMKITLKSWLLMMLTWALWLYGIYYLVDKYHILLSRPLVGSWTLQEVLEVVGIVLLVQLNFLFVWSIIVQKRIQNVHGRQKA
ncbi:hypothetical protein [Neisseria sp. S1]|uniref:hypothetical protein n=1 Tax=Neisseria sp. S1 TaxID=3318354 RepID=UPI003A861722